MNQDYSHDDTFQSGDNSANYLVLFETDFEGQALRGKNIDDIFYQYNEYAKDQGFKLSKSVRKNQRDPMIEQAMFTCLFGHANVIKKGGYKKLAWKNQIMKNQAPVLAPCKARVHFDKYYADDWVLREVHKGHNHEPDPTMLSNDIIYFIDELVTGRGCNISPMEVATVLRAKYKREFDLPSLFHHLSQRFDIYHKSDNVEFIKDLMKEFQADVRDPLFDELQVHKVLCITNEMIQRYEQFGNYMLCIDSLFSPKFISNYFLILSGINPIGEIQVYGVLIVNKDILNVKNGLLQFLKIHNYQQPQVLIIDSDPFILEACTQTFKCPIQFSIYHVVQRTKKIFKESEYLQKAMNLVKTDLFLREYLDLSLERQDPPLTFDQHNFLYFLHQNKQYWQPFYINTPLNHYGINNINRYSKGDNFLKLKKTINSKVTKIQAKNFKAQLEMYQSSPLSFMYNKYKDRMWYRSYLSLITIQNTAGIFPPLLSILQLVLNSKLALIYLFNEYNESNRWRIINQDQNQVYIVHQAKQLIVTQQKHIHNQDELAIDQIKQREWQTNKHKLLMNDDEDIEEVKIENNGQVTCSCFYEKEYGGLPCRHKFRVMLELKKELIGLMMNVDKFWLIQCSYANKTLNPEIQQNNQ